MSPATLTPAKRVAVAFVSAGYIVASHQALAGGLLLRAVWIVLGLGLARLLVASAVPAQLGWPIGGRGRVAHQAHRHEVAKRDPEDA